MKKIHPATNKIFLTIIIFYKVIFIYFILYIKEYYMKFLKIILLGVLFFVHSEAVHLDKKNNFIKTFNDKHSNFKEKRVYTSNYIIKNDKIGCSEKFIQFSKELLISKYNIPSEHIIFQCKSVIDHKGLLYTMHYKMILF